MLGLALLYVGAVLFLNGIWVMGYIEDRRPNANADPYVVATLMTNTICEALA